MPGQSGPGINGSEGVLRIPKSTSITGTSPSDCLVLYPRHSLGGVLPLCRGTVSVFYSPSRLGNNLRELICHKTQQNNQTKYYESINFEFSLSDEKLCPKPVEFYKLINLFNYQHLHVNFWSHAHTHTHTHTHIYIQCITKVSTPLTFVQIFKYTSSWDNTDKMTLWLIEN